MAYLDLDLRRNKSGYSGSLVIEDDTIAVTLLYGNEYRSSQERYARVELKQIHATVLADRAAFGDLNADAPADAWRSMAIGLLREHITFDQLTRLVAASFEAGRTQGRRETQSAIRATLGL